MGLRRLLLLSFLAAILAIELCSSKPSKKTPRVSAPRSVNRVKYMPTWTSLDSRPVPDWYDEAKVGILVTWGVHSVPGFGPNFWRDWKDSKKRQLVNYMRKYYPRGFSYQEFASSFKADLFNPKEWVRLFKEAGAKYVMLSAKEDDGYTMFSSKYSPHWNALDIGPGTDVMNELAGIVRNNSLRFGMHYSLSEWNHPLYLQDKAANWTVANFSVTKVLPELKEAINNFRPDVLWVDSLDNASDTYWNSKKLLTWVFNDSPIRDSVVVNDRWGGNATCKHGGISTCHDPKTLDKQPKPQKKWELMLSLDKKSRGFRRNMNSKADLLDLKTIVQWVIKTVAKGGNILINVGAHSSGTIPLVFQERLRGLGKWLKANGEAIYGTRGNDKNFNEVSQGTEVFYTQKSNRTLYGMFTKWPKKNTLKLRNVLSYFGEAGPLMISLLGKRPLSFEYETNGTAITVNLPRENEACGEVAWVLKFQLGVVSIPKPISTTTKKPETPKPTKPPTRRTYKNYKKPTTEWYPAWMPLGIE